MAPKAPGTAIPKTAATVVAAAAPKTSVDQELAVVKTILAALEPLDPNLRSRVLRAAEALLGVPYPVPPIPLAPRK